MRRILKVALFELGSAVRSRRAFVTMLLFTLVGAGVMYLTVSIFASLEEQLVKVLALPAADNTGSVTMALWKSDGFRTIVSHILGSELLLQDVAGQHPIALAFAGFVFSVVPLMTLITSAPTAAGEIRSGSVRYVLLRVTRTEWTLGVFLAEAGVLLLATVLLAAAAALVSLLRLPGLSALEMLPSLFIWALRAWIYSFAWLGVCTGLSLCVKSPGKATGLALLVYLGFSVLGIFADGTLFWLDYLRPQGFKDLLWRSSFPALLQGVVGTFAVAFAYLGLGSAVFRRRDV